MLNAFKAASLTPNLNLLGMRGRKRVNGRTEERKSGMLNNLVDLYKYAKLNISAIIIE